MGATHFTGKDFAFLITPDSIPWTKSGNNYQVGKDEFSYARESDGIEMRFNAEIKFEKARKIVEEVVEKLTKHTGQEVEVLLRS
jgi:hypothetical protein